MQGHPFVLRPSLVVSLFLLTAIGAQAQDSIVRASVRSVKGSVLIHAGPDVFVPKVNVELKPGHKIETGRTGRLAVWLTDGSQITILPSSLVTLKNFRDPQTARDLLEIVVGRVLVKIHHFGNKPNPYSLSSPAASIAVRGTEFVVDVQSGGETLVLVREGLVEVWPRDNPDNKRLVTPGGRVTVQPGGRISSAFPGPARSIESVAQSTNDISPIFFSAFPDQHLDSLDNPAYAADFKEAQGRLLLLPSISEPYVDERNEKSTSEDPPSFDYSVSPQLTFFTPIPGTRFVIGGGVSALRTKLREQTDIEYTGYRLYNRVERKVSAVNASIIAAYSFGDDGRTSVGISIDGLAGDHKFSNRYINEWTSYYPNVNGTHHRYNSFGDTNAYFSNTHLTLGLTRRLSKSAKIGLYYRHGFSSSDQDGYQIRESYHEDRPSDSYFVAGRGNISAFSSSSEIGVRLRSSLTRRLFYGTEGSYLYDRVRSQGGSSELPPIHSRYLARRARVGVGLGFLLTSKILLNLDVAGGLFNTGKPVDQPIISGLNSMSFLALSQFSPRSIRGSSISIHAAVQANPWRNLIISSSTLVTVRKDVYTDIYNDRSYTFADKYKMGVSGVGLGWKLKPNVIAEYLISAGYSDRVPSHSIRLRYTFNLGITNEK